MFKWEYSNMLNGYAKNERIFYIKIQRENSILRTSRTFWNVGRSGPKNQWHNSKSKRPGCYNWLFRINLIWYHYFPISKIWIFSIPPLPERKSYSVFLLFNTNSHYFSYTILLPKPGTLSGKSCICSPLTTKFL